MNKNASIFLVYTCISIICFLGCSSPSTSINPLRSDCEFPLTFGSMYASTAIRVPEQARLIGYFNENGNGKYVVATFLMSDKDLQALKATLPISPAKPSEGMVWLDGSEVKEGGDWWFPHLIDDFEGGSVNIDEWNQFTFHIQISDFEELFYVFIKWTDAR